MPLPKWFSDKAQRQERNRASAKQERNRAKELQGKVQPGSGSSRRAPQDIKARGILEQVKFTRGKQVTIDVYGLIQLLRDAERDGRSPQYTIDFERYGIRFIGRVESIPESRVRGRVRG